MSPNEPVACSAVEAVCPKKCTDKSFFSVVRSHWNTASTAMRATNCLRRLFSLNNGFSLTFKCSLDFYKKKDNNVPNSDSLADCKVEHCDENFSPCSSDRCRLKNIQHLEDQIDLLKRKLRIP